MVNEFGKRRGMITDVRVQGGGVLCKVEDMNRPGETYPHCLLTNSSANTVDIPPQGSKVIVEKVDSKKYVTNIISFPSASKEDDSDLKKSALSGNGSMKIVFGSREEASFPESLSIQHTEDGYVFDLALDGDITINSKGGDVKIKEGGTAKKVLTEDAVFEYEDTGDSSDGSAGSTVKTTSKVSNSEKTEVELE